MSIAPRHDDPAGPPLAPDSEPESKITIQHITHNKTKAYQEGMAISIHRIFLANNNPNINLMDLHLALHGVRLTN